ncbi:MAG: hypothetical protein U1F47_15475 [Hyphomicrobiales bacterium]|jgi:hypothetical protein
MTLTFLDVALPIGLGAVFGAWRYMKRLEAKAPKALTSSLADGLKGTVGLAIITLAYKYFLGS